MNTQQTRLHLEFFSLKKLAALFFILLMFNATITSAALTEKNTVDVEWYSIADNIYQLRYEHHYTLFAVTQKGVVVFDPLSNDAAEHLVHAIKTVAPKKPLQAIIYSHWHVDHATGSKILQRKFGANVPIIAHEKTLAQLKKQDDKNIPLPTHTVSDKGEILHYGNTDIELHYMGYGHTDTMLIARFAKQRLIYVIDFANNDSTGWREMPGIPLDELIAMQQRLLNLDFDKVAFAHGRAGPGNKETIKRQIAYYKNLLTEVKAAVKEGLSVEDTVARVSHNLPQYRGWKNYKRWFQMNVRGVYRWVTENPASN